MTMPALDTPPAPHLDVVPSLDLPHIAEWLATHVARIESEIVHNPATDWTSPQVRNAELAAIHMREAYEALCRCTQS